MNALLSDHRKRERVAEDWRVFTDICWIVAAIVLLCLIPV